jgi:hypothetical protein
VTSPTIPVTEFVPRPDAVPAQWGIVIRRWDGVYLTDELFEPSDATINDVPFPWMPDTSGSGVLFARMVKRLYHQEASHCPHADGCHRHSYVLYALSSFLAHYSSPISFEMSGLPPVLQYSSNFAGNMV